MQAKRRPSNYRQKPLELCVEISLPYNGPLRYAIKWYRKLASTYLKKGNMVFFFFFKVFISVSPARIKVVQHVHVWKGSDTPGITLVMCGWEPSCECWGLNPGPQQEQQCSNSLNHGAKTTPPRVLFFIYWCVFFFFKASLVFILCIWVSCLCTTSVQFLQRTKEGVRSFGTGITNGCYPPCEH